ncbi:PAS domain S-box protein [bacterium]|nr:PAS domain S-box protein [bacterium]
MGKGTDLLTRASLGADGLPVDAAAWFASLRGMASEDAARALRLHEDLDASDLHMAQHEAVWVADIESHRLCGLTSSAASIYGRPFAELLETPGTMWEAILAEDRDELADFFTQCVEGRAAVRYFRIERPDGEIRHISERAVLLPGADGRPRRAKGMLIDVTDEQRLTDTLDLFRFAIDKAQDAVFIMDTDFRFLEVNEAACLSLGYDRRELIGMQVPEVDVDFPSEALDQVLDVLRQEGYVMLEGRHKTRDGRIFPVEIASNHFEINDREIICVFARDISKRQAAEVERRERLGRLERHKRAFAKLAGAPDLHEGGRREALKVICETGSEALNVERASVWLLDESQEVLRCENLYVRTSGEHLDDIVLDAGNFPAYFEAFRTSHLVDAHAAATDPRTSEFAADYLKPLGITSMLDVSIRMSGRLVGVVCFEHVGPPRTWTSEETTFAGTISETVAHQLERCERQRREAQLGEERRKLKTLISSLPGMAFRIRKADDWPVEFISDGSTELTGWTPYDLIDNRNVRHKDVVHPEDQMVVWEAMDDALRNRYAYEVEYRIITKQGEEKWVWEKGQGVYDESGELIAAEGFVTDISGRIRAEQAMRDSEFRHRELFNNMSSGVAVFETDGGLAFRCTDLNKAGEHIDDLAKNDIIASDAREVFPGLEACGLLDVMKRVWRTGRPEGVDAFVYRDDWGESWREAYVYKLPGGEIVLVYEDVSGDMMRQADLRLKQFSINQSSDSLFWISRDGAFIDVNETSCSSYGYTRDELMRMSVYDLTDEYTPGSWQQKWREIREHGTVRKEGYHKGKNGKIFPVDISINYLEFEGREYLCAMVRDITARKATEEHINSLNQSLEKRVEDRTAELRDSREKYRLLIESLREKYVFYSLTPKGTFTYISPSVTNVLGYEIEYFRSNDVLSIVAGERRDEVLQSTMLSLKGREQPSIEAEIRHRDGSLRVMDVLQVPVCDASGKVISVEGIAHDVTESRRAREMIRDQQDQLLESEKMAALGSLVAGVAHEINTPVGIGVTAASHLQERVVHFRGLYESGKLRRSEFETFLQEAGDSTRMIMSNLDKAAQLIQGFKGVAVDQTGEGRRSFDLKQYLNEILLSLRPEFKRTGHKVTLACDEGVLVDSYPGAVSHMITNLVMNSLIHGFDGVEEGEITIEATSDGENATIVYADNGVGMSKEIRRQIYDPFFTTRRGQGGSGLGMHVVYNSVTNSLGGSISCASSPGEGATFTIEFPLRNGSGDDAAR